MAGRGYVKLWRDAIDHEVFADPWLWKLFCWCIMKANFKPIQNHGRLIPRGSFTTGRNIAAEELNSSPSRVYRGFQRLSDIGCIVVTPNSNWTTITVCHYETYNSAEESERTSGDTSGDTASGQLANTGKEFNKPRNQEVIQANGFSQAFQMAWDSWPPNRRVKKQTAQSAWQDAVARLAFRFEADPRKAEDWLADRVRAYVRSPRAGCRFCLGIANWLTGGNYDDAAEAWQETDKDDAVPSGSLPEFDTNY